MSFIAEIDDYAAQGAEKAAEPIIGGDFPPVPKGPYQVVILENRGVEDYTKDPSNDNYGKKVVSLHVQVDSNSPTAAGRHYFVRVPLFSRYAPNPNAKTDEGKTIGSPARMFYSFFRNVMGVPLDHILAKKPLPSDVEGKRMTLILGAPKAPDRYNPLGFNDTADVDAPQDDFSKTPIVQPGATVAPWLTPEGGLNPNWTPPAAGGGVPGIGGGVPGLAGPGAGVPGLAGPSAGIPGLAGPGAGVPQMPAAPAVAPLQTGYAPQPTAAPAYAEAAPTGHQAAPPAGYTAGGAFPGHVVPQDAPQAPGAPLAQPAQVQVPSTVPAAWAGPAAGAAQAAVGQGGY